MEEKKSTLYLQNITYNSDHLEGRHWSSDANHFGLLTLELLLAFSC